MEPYVLTFKSDTTDGLAGVQQMVNSMKATEEATLKANAAQQTLSRLRQELTRLEAQQKKEAFDALPNAEKLNQLYARRAELAGRLAAAERESIREAALKVAAADTDSQIQRLERLKTREDKGAADAQAQARDLAQRKEAEALAQRQLKSEQALSEWRRQIAASSKQEREQAFARLPLEEKLAVLYGRREELASRLVRAGDNERRATALQLLRSQNDERIRDLEREKARAESAAADKQALADELARRKETEAQTQRQVKAEQTLSDWRKQISAASRRERDEAFAKLPIEERLNQLYARRAEIAVRIERAGENERRRTALQLVQARNEERIRGVEREKTGADSASAGMLGSLFGAASFKKSLGIDSFKELLTGAGLRKIFTSGLGQLGGGLGLAALSGVGISKAHELLSNSSRLENQAAGLGIGTEALQEFEFAAGKSGASAGDVNEAVETAGVSQFRALHGNKALIDSFKRLGIGAKELQSQKPEEIFKQIADAVEKAPSGATHLADVLKVLGDRADNLVPAFRNGFSAAIDEARKAGVIIESDVTKQLDGVESRMELLGKSLSAGFAFTLSKTAGAVSGVASKAVQEASRAFAFLGALSTGDRITWRDLKPASEIANKQVDSMFDEGKKPPSQKMENRGAAAARLLTAEQQRNLEELRGENLKAIQDMQLGALKPEEQINLLMRQRLEILRAIRREQDPTAREVLIATDIEAQKKLAELERSSPINFDAARNALLKERAEILRQIASATDAAKKADLRGEADTLTDRLKSLDKESALVKPDDSKPVVDQLQRMGLIVGKPDNRLLDAARRQTVLLDQLNRNTLDLQNIIRQKL